MFLNYYSLEALEAVVREKSFSLAAEALHITQSAVSQRIKELERLVEQPLIVRSPEIRPTKAGLEALAHFKKVSMLEDELKSSWLSKRRPMGPQTISIALNTESLSTWFIDAVSAVVSKGDIVLELLIDDQERTIKMLQSGRVWGCVTSVARPPFGCASTLLGKMVYRCAATPAFKGRYFAGGIDARSLLAAPAAIYGDEDYMHDNFLRKLFKRYKDGRPTAHHIPSPEGLVDFALKGMAFALLPEFSIKEHLKSGRLVDLIPGKPLRLPLYWQTQELQTKLTREFSEIIIKKSRAVLEM
jgi:LysR family transcriptional regulator (chromosome initiation inhibitor)